jgi:hypothetical protein
MELRAGLVGLTALVVSCSAPPKTLSDYCFDLASIVCDKAASCGTLTTTKAECLNQGVQACCTPTASAQAFSCGDPVTNPENAQKCKDAMAQLSCGQLTAGLTPATCQPPKPPPPTAGAPCATTSTVCGTSSHALECVRGTWRAVQCRGPGGCHTDATYGLLCDLLGQVEPGDGCFSSQEGTSMCSFNDTAVLNCQAGVWVSATACNGPTCQQDATGTRCR